MKHILTWIPLYALLVAGLLAACGGDTTDPTETPSCDRSTGGQYCANSAACPAVTCRCENGSQIASRSCINEACAGAEICVEVCAAEGSTDACESPAEDRDTGTPEEDDTGSGDTCEADLSDFATYDRSYSLSCLEQNCCNQAAYCETFAACKAYDNCIFACSSGGTIDPACIRTCRDTHTTGDFLDDAYSPFMNCALGNGC